MKYITGQHALNLKCSLDTTGDWHTSALQWQKPFTRNTKDSVFGEYGIEDNKEIPENRSLFKVANHIRALMDLLEIGNFALAQGMNKDYICNDLYTEEIFNQVLKLRSYPHWGDIDKFMGKEYMRKWLDYKELEKEV